MAIDNDDEDDDGGGGQLVCPLFAYLIGLLLQCSAKIPAPRLPSSSWRARVISNFFLTDNFHSLLLLQSYLLSGKLSDQPPFDLLIHLKSRAVPRKAQALDFPTHITIRQTLYDGEAAENGDKSGSSLKTAMPIVDWDPVARYLDSLKAAFDNQALFFVDEYGGRTIGVLLRPEALEVRPFRLATLAATSAAMLTGTAYSSAADNVALNLPALIEDLTVMGEGLVERVVLGERQKQQTK